MRRTDEAGGKAFQRRRRADYRALLRRFAPLRERLIRGSLSAHCTSLERNRFGTKSTERAGGKYAKHFILWNSIIIKNINTLFAL